MKEKPVKPEREVELRQSLISLSVSLWFCFVWVWTFNCITLLFEQSNLFVFWTLVGEASTKYSLQATSVQYNSGLHDSTAGHRVELSDTSCIIFRQSPTTWSRMWRTAKALPLGEVQRMGTNVSISMKDCWVNCLFLSRGSFRLTFRWNHVWARLQFLHSQRLFLTT